MTGSLRVNHHDRMKSQASRGNLPPPLRHTAASAQWLIAPGEDRAAWKGPVKCRSSKGTEARGARPAGCRGGIVLGRRGR